MIMINNREALIPGEQFPSAADAAEELRAAGDWDNTGKQLGANVDDCSVRHNTAKLVLTAPQRTKSSCLFLVLSLSLSLTLSDETGKKRRRDLKWIAKGTIESREKIGFIITLYNIRLAAITLACLLWLRTQTSL